MTNIFGRPEKHERKRRLFQGGIETLESLGYVVEKIPGIGKSSVRQITKDGRTQKVAIRTTQDQWMSFHENDSGTGWGTLEDVDLVMVVSVDSVENPRVGRVHLFEQADITARFNRARDARLQAGRVNPTSHGLYVAVYGVENAADPYSIGAGAGDASPPIAVVQLDGGNGPGAVALPPPDPVPPPPSSPRGQVSEEAPLSIPEAKRRLALTLGVDPSAIKISVEA